jgi:NAD(P)H-dependent FMN reductase
MKILALSGSLRAGSINSAALRAAARLAAPGIEVQVYGALGELPLFNPDREADSPMSVLALQCAVSAADGLLIASPEYAHGVSGTIKNALDWLVGFAPFAGKRVAVLNTSPRSWTADAALRETLRTMAAIIVEPASIAIPLLGSRLDEDGMIADAAVAGALRAALSALRGAIASGD